MSSQVQPPTRPPREGKIQKEGSGLLMSVIRTLSASENNEQRDKEKAKLEREFRRSDQRLDELVSAHHEDLSATMQAFSRVSSRLTASQDKIRSVKHGLIACKELLNCKRGELRHLWLEGVEHKQVFYLLEQIDQLKDAPVKVASFMNKKLYLHATEVLVQSESVTGGDLSGVDALREVGLELQSKREQIYNYVIQDLHRHVYVRSTQETGRLSRHGSTRGSRRQGGLGEGIGTPVKQLQLDVNVGGGSVPCTPTKHRLYINRSDGLENSQPVEDMLTSDPEEDSFHFIKILVECLAKLNRLPEAVEAIKSKMQGELVSIIRQASQEIQETSTNVIPLGLQSNAAIPALVVSVQGSFPGPPNPLLTLLQKVCDNFHSVAKAHECVLTALNRVSATSSQRDDIQLYDMADVWSKIQAVLQMLITDYLDMENMHADQAPPPSSFSDTTMDISSYFSKKKINKPKKFSLFRFSVSSHAISLNSYLREQREQAAADGQELSLGRTLVTPPEPNNITVVFTPLMRFISQLEHAIQQSPGTHCTLHTFLTDYVKNAYLAKVHSDVSAKLDAAIKGLDTWNSHTDPEMQKALQTSRPLLQSTVMVEEMVRDLRGLVTSLPLYSFHFLDMAINLLNTYREACVVAYRAIIQTPGENRRIISATWAKDEDISRFLKSLPNWNSLLELRGLKSPDTEESSEDVRLRNQKETEMLTGNLQETVISAHETLTDYSQLRALGLLQESIEWLAGRVQYLVSGLPIQPENSPPNSSPTSPTEITPVPESTIQAVLHSSRDLLELADTCLLILHLEVRVHCFSHLLPLAKQGSFASGLDSQDPDPEILKLNKDLSSIEEALSSTLQTRKIRYVFEGLSHLIASLLISSAHNIRRINEHGVKRMCRNIFALQQNLTNITIAREVALDRARQYYELLYHKPEEIVNHVMEQGPQFTELDYMTALNLKHRSEPGSDPGELQIQLERLSEVLVPPDQGVKV